MKAQETIEWEAKYEENKIEEFYPTHLIEDDHEERLENDSYDFEFKPDKPLSETLLAKTQQ